MHTYQLSATYYWGSVKDKHTTMHSRVRPSDMGTGSSSRVPYLSSCIPMFYLKLSWTPNLRHQSTWFPQGRLDSFLELRTS
jgi:hypothetical protein